MGAAESGMAHVKSMIAGMFPSYFVPPEHHKYLKPFGEMFKFLMAESGYAHIQGTKPDTVGKLHTKIKKLPSMNIRVNQMLPKDL